MNKKVFQAGDIITPEFLNALQNQSFNLPPNLVGHLPNPDKTFNLQQWKTFVAENEEESPTCTVNFGEWDKNSIIISNFSKSISIQGKLKNAVLLVFTTFTPDEDELNLQKAPYYSITLLKNHINLVFFGENWLPFLGGHLPLNSPNSIVEFKKLALSELNATSINTTSINASSVNSSSVNVNGLASIRQERNTSFIHSAPAQLYVSNQIAYEEEVESNSPCIYLSNYGHQGLPAGCTSFLMNKTGMASGVKVCVFNSGSYPITITSVGPGIPAEVDLPSRCVTEFITDGITWYPIT